MGTWNITVGRELGKEGCRLKGGNQKASPRLGNELSCGFAVAESMETSQMGSSSVWPADTAGG